MTKSENALRTLDFAANSSTTFKVRMFEIDGEPWFVATDVCRSLGLDVEYGSTSALRKLTKDERQTIPRHLVPGSGRGMAQATLISEPGLFKLMERSDKPEAKAFNRWVRHDVLPAIRKTGGYLLNEEARETAKADDRQAMPLPEGVRSDYIWGRRKLTTRYILYANYPSQ
jgi:prophage antirepressor-like protein